MNWQAINEFVEAWTVQQRLPADLKGKTLLLVDFESEEDCHFFYPDRTQLAQTAFTSAVSKFARARRARTEHIKINPEHYRTWLLAERLEDTQENRSQFIESRYRVLPMK